MWLDFPLSSPSLSSLILLPSSLSLLLLLSPPPSSSSYYYYYYYSLYGTQNEAFFRFILYSILSEAFVNRSSSLYVVKFNCNVFRLVCKDQSLGWRDTREKLRTTPCGAREYHTAIRRYTVEFTCRAGS
jgi:hypothetical protein